MRLCSSFGSSRTVNLSGILPCGVQTLYLWFVIQLWSLGQGLFIPLVRDSIIIIRSRSVYTFGSRFTYKRWVGVLSKIWILAFLGKYSNIFVGSQSVLIEVRIIWYQSTGSKISFLSLLSFVSYSYKKKKKKSEIKKRW